LCKRKPSISISQCEKNRFHFFFKSGDSPIRLLSSFILYSFPSLNLDLPACRYRYRCEFFKAFFSFFLLYMRSRHGLVSLRKKERKEKTLLILTKAYLFPSSFCFVYVSHPQCPIVISSHQTQTSPNLIDISLRPRPPSSVFYPQSLVLQKGWL
jgi:hypothetical protein